MAPAVTMRPLPAMTSVDGSDHQVRVHARHDVGVARLADRGDATVTNTDVGLDDSPVIDDHRTGDDGVRGALGPGGARLAHRLAKHLAAAEHRFVTRQPRPATAVLGDLDEQVGVRQPDAVAGGGSEQRGVPRPGQSLIGASALRASAHRCLLLFAQALIAHPTGPAGSATVRAPLARPRSGTSETRCATPGSNRTAVPAGMSRR